MTLFRIVLLLGAAWLLWRLYRKLQPHIQQSNPPKPKADYQLTARCVRCGVHAPRNTLSSTGVCGRCVE